MGKLKTAGATPQAAEAPASAPAAESSVTMNELDHGIAIKFKLDPRLYALVKTIPGAKFDGDSKAWMAPTDQAAKAIEVVERMRAEEKASKSELTTLHARLQAAHPDLQRETAMRAAVGPNAPQWRHHSGQVIDVGERFAAVLENVKQVPRIVIHDTAALFRHKAATEDRQGPLEPFAPQVGEIIAIGYTKGRGFVKPVTAENAAGNSQASAPRQAPSQAPAARQARQPQGEQAAAPEAQQGAKNARAPLPKPRAKQQGLAP